ncbi:MAG: S-methyl-5'-thioadenosine phosphorylase [Thermoleophilia bacterium]|nr:S-methyl-5'-thioadenosine phosphorylase [Thermoleophilia bacterium]MDH3725273.1 S-methyl-5'-thioadenosine phosphorylase [Thermoleophilia bacterium]
MSASAEIGVFGGSGFYRFLDDVREVEVQTPYGRPSSPAFIAELAGRTVAFMPRHGLMHELPPHRINYRANVWAMKELGVRWVLGPCASGSLQPGVGIGDFVVCDQFVDRTGGRADTFYDGPGVTHIAAAEPYSPVLRGLLIDGCRELGISVHPSGTLVVIQGPRFSSRAESRWFSQMGWEVVGMTGYPEAILARELELCYATVALVTDYDAGLDGRQDVPEVIADEVVRVFGQNVDRVRRLLEWVIPRVPRDIDPHCADALEGARISPPSAETV